MASAQNQSASGRPFRIMALPQEIRDQIFGILTEIDAKMIAQESAEHCDTGTQIHIESGVQARYTSVSRAFQRDYLTAIERRRRAGLVKMTIFFGLFKHSWIPFGYCDQKFLKDVTDLEISFQCHVPCVRFEREREKFCELDDICSCGHFLETYTRQVDMLLAQMPLRQTP